MQQNELDRLKSEILEARERQRNLHNDLDATAVALATEQKIRMPRSIYVCLFQGNLYIQEREYCKVSLVQMERILASSDKDINRSLQVAFFLSHFLYLTLAFERCESEHSKLAPQPIDGSH